MAMTILNNTAAQMTLGELNKNITEVGKELAKISKGERIYGAVAGASEYAISENMRVKIRSLGQDEMNVKGGQDLLNVAGGAIQNQLNLMRTIKERVLNAANDTNTDTDRAIIQKEINQFLNEIEDITYETNYNGKYLLHGNYISEKEILKEWDVFNPTKTLKGQKVEWKVLELADGEDAKVVDGSSLDIIPNVYQTLDGIEGPFDIFTPFKNSAGLSALPALSLAATNVYDNGTMGDSNHTILDLSGYNTIDEMDGLNFVIDGKRYILSTDTNARYDNKNGNSAFGVNYSNATSKNSSCEMIDISGKTMDQVVNLLSNKSFAHRGIQSLAGVPSTSSDSLKTNGSKVVLKTTGNYATKELANEATITSTEKSDASTKTVVYNPGSPATSIYQTSRNVNYPNVSGINLPGNYLTGGVVGYPKNEADPDSTEIKAVAPRMEIDVTSAGEKGITLSYPSDSYPYNTTSFNLKFVADSRDGFTAETTQVTRSDGTTTNVSTGVWTVGTQANTNLSISTKKGNLTLNIKNGKLTITGPALNYSKSDPDYNPNTTFGVSSGIKNHTYSFYDYTSTNPAVERDERTEDFRALKEAVYTNMKDASDSERAYVTMKLDPSQYQNGEDLVDKISGYEFQCDGYRYKFYDGSSTAPNYNNYFDPTTGDSFNIKGAQAATTNTRWIDVSALKNSPSADTLAKILQSNMVLPTDTKVTVENGEVRIPSSYIGTAGNNKALNVYEGMELAHYDIDFAAYFAANPDVKLPDDLYGKGFMVYCASDPNQWFNFNFTGNVIEGQDDKPVIEKAPDIKNVFVDISDVQDPAELVKKIEESANPQLNTIDNGKSHYIFTQALSGTSVLRIYDNRPFNPADSALIPKENIQKKGAKVTDGLADYLLKTYTNIYEDGSDKVHHEIAVNRKEERLIIHDTTKANRDITLHIPRMTLDQMVSVPEEDFDKNIFSVMTKESRDALLGKKGDENTPEEKGYLDTAIDYLTGANVIIGSQIMRLQLAENNIVTQNETTTASESVIRDADMAKEITSYTKSNILSQSAQAMLAQANQTAAGVLGLLR